MSGKIQYLQILIRGEALHEFYALLDMIGTLPKKKDSDYFVTRYVFFCINLLLNKNHVMCSRRRKLRVLKIRCYAAHMFELNNYLASFLGLNGANEFLRHSSMELCYIEFLMTDIRRCFIMVQF